MADGTLTLITGRSMKQGTGISLGKGQTDYGEATAAVELSRADMTRFGLADGDRVRLRTSHGEITVKCRAEDLPEGMAFMAFGPLTGQLIGGETQLSGMPDAKDFLVELETIGETA